MVGKPGGACFFTEGNGIRPVIGSPKQRGTKQENLGQHITSVFETFPQALRRRERNLSLPNDRYGSVDALSFTVHDIHVCYIYQFSKIRWSDFGQRIPRLSNGFDCLKSFFLLLIQGQ